MINFKKDGWDKIKENSSLWWEGKLGRPLIQIRLLGADPGRKKHELPDDSTQKAFYMQEIPPEQIIDFWDYELSRLEYMGDAFPHTWLNSGPGVLAAFSGAEAETKPGTVWFHSPEDKQPEELSFEFDPENIWFKRTIDLCDAAIERWEGTVQVGMTDLGGAVDILSTFRPGANLLLDLYDKPDEVKRLVGEIHASWWKYYEEINNRLKPANPGHTAWTPIFSEKTYYMLQCDFAYMIGPQMFDEFVKPELAASCKKLGNAFYHLDGPGQIAHLDSLLSIKELKGVQWIPGAGKPGISQWPEVYRKICDSGKLVQIYIPQWSEAGNLDRIAEQISSPENIVCIIDMHISKKNEAVEMLKRYGATA